VSGPTKAVDAGWAATLARDPALSGWPLVIAVDDAERAAKSPINFLWTTFTRFEPAADVHASDVRVFRNHIAYTAPVVIDARLKPGFPEELVCDPETAATVTRRWKEYFPQGLAMGDSDLAHLD
jgi:3-polyprenyl-4-hydroxybenzoate decarboxylase